MEIGFDLELSQPELKRLAATLGCKDNETPFKFIGHCRAAAREYLDFYINGFCPRPSLQTLEYWLILLIREVFEDRIPREDAVARHFNITSSQSSRLMKNAISRYRNEVTEALQTSIGQILTDRKPGDDASEFTIWIEAKCLADMINQILQDRDKTLPAIAKKRGSTCSYIIKKSSYEALEDFCTEPQHDG
jgi:hypothetical protein